MKTSIEPAAELIEKLRNGDSVAAEQFWNQNFPQAVRIAGNRLRGVRYASADEEDIALTSISSLLIGLRENRYPEVVDQQSLWSLLVSIIGHKCVDLVRRENRQKRGGSGSEDVEAPDGKLTPGVPLDGLFEEQASPERSALMTERMESLVVKLNEQNDPDLLVIAVTKMLGDSTPEVAAQLGCVRRTVERKIQLIRRIWEEEITACI